MFRDRTLYYNRVWGKGFYALYLESDLGDITLQGNGSLWTVTAYRKYDAGSKLVFERTLPAQEPARELALMLARELERTRPNDWEKALLPTTRS